MLYLKKVLGTDQLSSGTENTFTLTFTPTRSANSFHAFFSLCQPQTHTFSNSNLSVKLCLKDNFPSGLLAKLSVLQSTKRPCKENTLLPKEGKILSLINLNQ